MSAFSGRSASILGDLSDSEEAINVVPRGVATMQSDKDEALRQAQLELDAIKEQCRVLQEKVRITEANKPRKSTKAASPNALTVFDTEIQTLAKKFGFLLEMFPPSPDVLSRPLTPDVSSSSPASLELVGQARYSSPLAEEAAILAELDSILPPHIQNIRMSNHFAEQLATGISNGRSSELHKLRNVAKDLFELPTGSHYLGCDMASRRLEFPEIRALLGIEQNSGKPKYPTFPPLLYANHKFDPHAPFSNWELLASILRVVLWGQTALTHDATRRAGGKANGTLWRVTCCTPGCLAWAGVIAVFIVSPDSQFPRDGTGATSEIPYHKLFAQYKRLFVKNWETPYLSNLVSKINQRVFGKIKARGTSATMNEEDLTADIDAAMAAMAMALPDSNAQQDLQGTTTGSVRSDQDPAAISLGSTLSFVVEDSEIQLLNDSHAGADQQTRSDDFPELVFEAENHTLGQESDLAVVVETVSAKGRGRGRGGKRGSKVGAGVAATTRSRRSAAQ